MIVVCDHDSVTNYNSCVWPQQCKKQSELLGQFRLISYRASDVSGGRICLTQNAYAEI